MSKRKKALGKIQKENNERLRKIYKVVDDYCYKEKSAEECMKKIVDLVYKAGE